MKKKSGFMLAATFLLTVTLNLIAWNNKRFCDFYVRYIFPAWINTYARLTGLVSFSAGEVMLAAGVVLLAASVLLGVCIGLLMLVKREWGKRLWKHGRKFYGVMLWLAAGFSLVMTCNCFILYHCSTFEEKYQIGGKEHRLSELAALRDYVVEKANALSKEVERDEYGNIVYTADMKAQAAVNMRRLSGVGYDQLAGYYPPPKGIMASGFLSQQYMLGYYFPFSMEANYNDAMYITNKPSTMCHELAHLKGFIYEDEANFISYMACINSEDKLFQYSGYLSVLNYVDNAFYEAVDKNRDVYYSHVKISGQVKRDNVFLTKDAWQKVEKKAVVSTEKVNKAADRFLQANLEINGVEDGIVSYTRVVGLLLDFYDGSLYERDGDVN